MRVTDNKSTTLVRTKQPLPHAVTMKFLHSLKDQLW
jgi:hypothetical protein